MKNIIKNLANSLRNILPKEFLLKKYGLLAVGERLRPNFMTVTMDAVNSSDYNIIVSENFSYPFEENSLKVIYTSHNIEHYSDQVAIKFFQECYRVLRSGGEVLIEVPDAKLLYDKLKKYYDDGDMSILEIFNWEYKSENVVNNINKNQPNADITLLNSINSKFSGYISCYCDPYFIGDHTPILISENIFKDQLKNLNMDDFFSWLIGHQSRSQLSSGGHCSAWYFEKLKSLLEGIGFKVALRGYKQSTIISSFMVPDRHARSNYSFRISAIK